MKQFFEELKSLLKEAINEDYNSLLKLCGNESPYCCALVTDSDATTLFFAVNTREKFNEKTVKVGEKYQAYYKWTPAEWAYGDQLSDKKMISKVSDVLAEKSEEEEVRNNFLSFETGLYECMTTALKELSEESSFSKMVKFISISDDKRARNVENYSAKLLNSEIVYSDFAKRFE